MFNANFKGDFIKFRQKNKLTLIVLLLFYIIL